MTTPTPNFPAAWDFLQAFHPGRLIVVTGVTLDKKGIPTETFGPNQRPEFLKWVTSAANSSCNIYFSVAEPLDRATKKLERTDIKAVHYLHVDVDPRVGEDLAQERLRIEALLKSPPGGLPAPTGIIFSGGGYQAYWKLSVPLEVNGDLAVAEDLKLYNLQIERLLGADNCHDVSRIMRVPGTINLPDAKKVKKGRVPTLAEVVEWHDDRTYDIGQFIKAVTVQNVAAAVTAGMGTKPKTAAPANIKRLAQIDELGDKISQSVKVYIVQGCNPDEPGHFPSRSEMLFWVVCELVRGGVDTDTIYSILTDPEFRISDSVLEKGTGAERYALRQIDRAQEQAVDPMLRELNDQHAVIENFGGRCVVIEEVVCPILERSSLTKQGFDHFRNRYMNRTVILGRKKDKNGNEYDETIPAGEWWLRHRQRRQYHRIVFAPGRDIPNAYNLWRGFGCDARQGDCTLFLNHLKEVLCSGNEDYYKYLIGWMARCVQFPAEQGHTSVVLQGRQGCGKSIVPEVFGSLFGRHYIMVSKPEHIVGNFNAHLRDCVFLFADEAFFAGDKRNESSLKTLVTERMQTVELKGIDAEQSANCTHLMMASNEKWVVPAGYDDRRYFVLKCSPSRVGDREYFNALVDQMVNKKSGREALLYYLLTYDLAGFDVRTVPKTEALREQKALSMDTDTDWWYQTLKRGSLLPEEENWKEYVALELLANEYLNYVRGLNVGRRSSATKLGMALAEMAPGIQRVQRRSAIQVPQADGSTRLVTKPWFYKMPSLEDCRKHFDKNFGGPYNWEADLPEEDIPEYGADDRDSPF